MAEAFILNLRLMLDDFPACFSVSTLLSYFQLTLFCKVKWCIVWCINQQAFRASLCVSSGVPCSPAAHCQLLMDSMRSFWVQFSVVFFQTEDSSRRVDRGLCWVQAGRKSLACKFPLTKGGTVSLLYFTKLTFLLLLSGISKPEEWMNAD